MICHSNYTGEQQRDWRSMCTLTQEHITTVNSSLIGLCLSCVCILFSTGLNPIALYSLLLALYMLFSVTLIVQVQSQACGSYAVTIYTNQYKNNLGGNVTIYCEFPDATDAFFVEWLMQRKCASKFEEVYYADRTDDSNSEPDGNFEDYVHGTFISTTNHSLTLAGSVADESEIACLVRTNQYTGGLGSPNSKIIVTCEYGKTARSLQNLSVVFEQDPLKYCSHITSNSEMFSSKTISLGGSREQRGHNSSFLFLPPSCFDSIGWFVCSSVCEQHYSNSYEK